MKRLTCVFLVLVLSFSFIFMGFGYAQLSNHLGIYGGVEVTTPEGLYITSVEPVSSSNGSGTNTSAVYPTNIATTVTRTGGWFSTGKVTYKVTLFNNSSKKYSYLGIVYDADNSQYNGNAQIDKSNRLTIMTHDNQNDTSATFNTSDSIEPFTERTFYVTYNLGRNLSQNTAYKTFINFNFGIHVDSVYDAADKTFAAFENILNDPTGERYEYLTDIIDDKYGGGGPNMQWQATYIGNVAGSLEGDSAKVWELFGGDLSVIIGGKETTVTMLIKREPLDDNPDTGDDYAIGTPGSSSYISAEGCEWTLYMTTESLDKAGSKPTVYSATFTRIKNDDGTAGKWFMIGDMYRGTATVIGYEGETDSGGSFQTDDWRSAGNETYTVTDTYSYQVGAGFTIEEVLKTRDQNANILAGALLNRAYGIIYDGEFAGTAVNQLFDAYSRASYCYTPNESGGVTVKADATRAELIPVIKELDAILKSFG